MQPLLKSNYNKILANYASTKEWLRSNGVDITKSRYERYAALLNKMSWATSQGKEATYANHASKLISATYEVSSLTYIWNALKFGNHPGLPAKLEKLKSGPEHYTQENCNSNLARNTLFELTVASTIRNMGLDIDLSQRADIRTERYGEKVFLECKRPMKRETLEGNLTEAISQVTGDLQREGDANSKAVIFVDLDKVINEELVSRKFGSIAAFDKEIMAIAKANIQNVGSRIRSKCEDRVVGMVSKIKVPLNLQGHKVRIAFGSFHMSFLFNEQSDASRQWLQKFQDEYLFGWNIDHRI